MSHLIAQENMHTFFKETVTNIQVLVSQLNKTNHQAQGQKWLLISTQPEKPAQDMSLMNNFHSECERQLQKVTAEHQSASVLPTEQHYSCLACSYPVTELVYLKKNN